MYLCTRCNRRRNVVYNIRYGMWNVNVWLCRYCAHAAWNEIGRSPAAQMRAKYWNRFGADREEVAPINSIPRSHDEEHEQLEEAFPMQMVGLAVD